MLQPLILDLPATQPRDDRLKRLARPLFDQPARVELGRATLLHATQTSRDVIHVRGQPLLDLRRLADRGSLLSLHNNGHSSRFAAPTARPSTTYQSTIRLGVTP